MGTVDEPRQEALLLRVRAAPRDLIHAEIRVRGVRKTDRCRRTADLFHRDDVREKPEARAAEIGGDGHAEQAEPAEPGPPAPREAPPAVDRPAPRRRAL